MVILTLFDVLIIISSFIAIFFSIHFIRENPETPLRIYVLFKTAMLGYVIFIYGCFLFDEFVYDIEWFDVKSFPYYAWPLILLFTVTFTLDALVRRAQDK